MSLILHTLGSISGLGLAVCLYAGGSIAAEHILWFDSPAAHFTQSCPIGNGRLGAMIFGGVDQERIVLNESGMWSGSPQDADRPDASAALPEIRRLLLEGRNAEAERLVNSNFTCAGPGSGRGRGARLQYGAYQALGNLHLKFLHGGGGALGPTPIPAQNYRRELDLSGAIVRISYDRGGIRYQREAFVSARDEAFVLRSSASRPASISFDVQLDRPERFQTVAVGLDGLLMTGQLEDGAGGANGVRYAARLRVLHRGGTVAGEGNVLRVRQADEVTLLVAASTDIRTFAGRKVQDVVETVTQDMERAAGKSFNTLRHDHVVDYQRYFNRVNLQLGGADSDAASRPIPTRLEALAQGKPDPGLMQLYFDFGRYLLISSSRPGGLPPNLQGLWAEEIQTPWNADWHLNVNVQMNYWPAETCNLSELHQPLFALIASLQAPGARTGQKYYGARGWIAHVITNPWGFTSPGEAASWGSSTSGSAWLCQHLWDHYLFTGDREFLSWAYPILKGASLFYSDILIEEPKHGRLVTAPSNSPENGFRMPDGQIAHVCMGPTIDMQLLRYLFDATEQAALILGLDPEFRKELAAKRARLVPTRVGSDGRIMEWLEDYAESDPQHRHVSHLWGLYPGHEIQPRTTPDLAAGARRTLGARGDGGTGWALAFKIALWARLGDGDRAYKLLCQQLKPASTVGRISTSGGGTYPNLFDAHPPFQIDGNFGATAGIAEMLVQSHASEVHLLPALPGAWPNGQVRGLRARGGFEVELLRWGGGKLQEAVIRSISSATCRVRAGQAAVDLQLAPGQSARLDGSLRQPE